MSLLEILFCLALAIAIGYAFVLQRCLAVLVAQRTREDLSRHSELTQQLSALAATLETAENRQQQRNLEQLRASLSGVVADFHQRLQVQFDNQLKALVKLARSSEELVRKQRDEQMEAMHHARRLAGRIDGAAQAFGVLVAENTELLAISGQVRDSLALLGPRQEAIDADLARQAEAVESTTQALDQLRSSFEEAAEQLLLQTRRSLDAMAQRQAQGNSALQKELSESLNKSIAGMSKQLSAMAPMTQQARIQTLR